MLFDSILWNPLLHHWILQLPLVHYFSWYMIGLITFSTHMVYTSVSMTEKIIRCICCFAQNYITVIHHASYSEQEELAFQSQFEIWCFHTRCCLQEPDIETPWQDGAHLMISMTHSPHWWTHLPAGLRPCAATTWDIIINLTLFCQPGIFILLRCCSQSVLKAPALHHNLCQKSHSVKIQFF